jgi:two-component sensor histidine kinase
VREAPLEFAKLGESFDLMAQGIEDREHALRGSVAEKDALLKEVYHRVKNNLQLVCSLVNLQLRDARNEHEREGLQRLQDRVYGLAAVHQRLSEAERVSAVRIDSLLTEIVQKARETRDGFDNTIEVTMDLIPYSEGPDRAIPIALFATEAIANAFEHALKSLESGWLHVSLSEVDADNVLLEITNALSEEAVQPSASRSGLGSQLIQGFTSQLRGNLERDIEPGKYSLRLRFPRAQD